MIGSIGVMAQLSPTTKMEKGMTIESMQK